MWQKNILKVLNWKRSLTNITWYVTKREKSSKSIHRAYFWAEWKMDHTPAKKFDVHSTFESEHTHPHQLNCLLMEKNNENDKKLFVFFQSKLLFSWWYPLKTTCNSICGQTFRGERLVISLFDPRLSRRRMLINFMRTNGTSGILSIGVVGLNCGIWNFLASSSNNWYRLQ